MDCRRINIALGHGLPKTVGRLVEADLDAALHQQNAATAVDGGGEHLVGGYAVIDLAALPLAAD